MCCSSSFLICSVLLYLSGQPIYMLIFPGWVIIINYCLCLFCTHFVFVIGFVFVYDYLVSVVTIFQLETSQVFCVLFYSVLNFHNCLFVGLETPSLLLPKSYLDFYVCLYFALPLEVNKHTNLRRIVTVRLQKVRQGFLKAAYVKKSPVHQNNTVGVIRLNWKLLESARSMTYLYSLPLELLWYYYDVYVLNHLANRTVEGGKSVPFFPMEVPYKVWKGVILNVSFPSSVFGSTVFLHIKRVWHTNCTGSNCEAKLPRW
jgi:hypothetical protein